MITVKLQTHNIKPNLELVDLVFVSGAGKKPQEAQINLPEIQIKRILLLA